MLNLSNIEGIIVVPTSGLRGTDSPSFRALIIGSHSPLRLSDFDSKVKAYLLDNTWQLNSIMKTVFVSSTSVSTDNNI